MTQQAPRAPRKPRKFTAAIKLWVTPDMKATLEDLAAKDEREVPYLIRLAIREWLDRQPEPV